MADKPIQTPPGTDPVPPVATPPEQPPTPPAEPKPEETVDYWKNKFSQSSREANLLREAEEARKKAEQDSTKQPTESDLRQAFPSWDGMTETEKDLARESLVTRRMAESAGKLSQEQQAINSWNTSIELAIASNDALLGKEQLFRQFASQPKYRGTDMTLLVDAFLHKNAPAPAPAPAPTPRPGLEPGNGGPRTPDKPKTLSADELKAMRTTDPKGYQDYLKTHEVDIDLSA